MDCGACEPVCPVGAISYEDDLPGDWISYLAGNAAFFAVPLPGRDDELDSPGGAAELGPLGADTPLVAGPAAAGRCEGDGMTMPRHDQPAAGRRAELLRLLRDAAEPMGIAEIADRLQVHPNTVRFHLETLVGNGQVERTTAEPGTPGRPHQLFQRVRGMDPMGPRHYRVLAEVLAAGLATDPEPRRRAVEAGRSWGRQRASRVTGATGGDKPVDAVESVERLMGMLDELAFAPEQAAGGDQPRIGLRHCPFLELTVSRSDVVCPVHLGLMQGAMESWGAPVTVDRLDAFVEPDLCMAHLTVVGPS